MKEKEGETVDRHPDSDTLLAFREHRLSGAAVSYVALHLGDCTRCANVEPQAARTALEALASPSDEGHLSDEDLDVLVDGRVQAPSYRAISHHAAACAMCRAEVEDLRRFDADGQEDVARFPVGQVRRPSQRWLMAAAIVFAALALSAIALLLRRTTPDVAPVTASNPPAPVAPGTVTPPAPRVMASLEDGDRRIALLEDGTIAGVELQSPRDAEDARAVLSGGSIVIPTFIAAMPGAVRGGSVSAHPLRAIEPFRSAVLEARPRFSWTPVRDASSYRVAVFDADSEEIARGVARNVLDAVEAAAGRRRLLVACRRRDRWGRDLVCRFGPRRGSVPSAHAEGSRRGRARGDALPRLASPSRSALQPPWTAARCGTGVPRSRGRESGLADCESSGPFGIPLMKVAALVLLLILPCVVMAQESPADLIAAAKTHYEARRYKEALAKYQEARTAAEAAGDTANAAYAKLGLAGLKTMYGLYDEGIVLASEALATFEAADNKPGQAEAFQNLGHLHMGNSKYAKAEELFRRCASLAEGARKATCLERVGECEVGRGQYRRAMATLREAIAVADASNNRVAHAAALGAIGDVHLDQGNAELAVYYHEKSLNLFRALGNTVMVSAKLNNLAISYDLMGRHDRALEAYRENLATMERLKYTRGIVISKMNIAGILIDLHRDEEAVQLLSEVLPMFEGVDDPDSHSNVLRHLAIIAERRGDLSGALEHARNAVSQPSEEVKDVYRSLTLAGHLYRKLGRFAEARTTLSASIDAIELMHTQASGDELHFFDEKSDPYAEMALVAIEAGSVEEALGYTERYRSRVLVDVLRSDASDRSPELTDEERKREHELLERLTALQRGAAAGATAEQKDQLTDARHEYDAFQHELADAHPRLHVARGTLPPIGANEIASHVPPGAALVEYLVTDEKTYAFVISGGTIAVRTIDVGREALAREAESFRGLLAGRRPDFRKTARSLHQTLIAPLADLLSKRHSWILIPDGPLWNLPFQALLDSRGTYVAEQAAIVYAPSIAAWMEMSRHSTAGANASTTSARRDLLAFGNPTTPSMAGVEGARGTLAPLPEAETEVKGAARFYGAESAVYIRGEATEERFKVEAPHYRVLHVAGHGVLNDASPMHSYLLLASGDAKKEDGYLEAGELMHMDLGAELVVLSACDTARGKYASGEGIIGFSWALFAARCRTQVVSQWKVDSAATSVLMRNFHRNVRNDSTKAASALQKTIMSMLKTPQYRHPFYWAGFVVLGDAS
jgi:CHAT domain-containing protein